MIYTSILLATALLPVLFLLSYIYKMDTIEKEPRGLLAKLFFFGALSSIAAGIIETVATEIVSVFLWNPQELIFMIVDNFLVVALTEEFCKRFVFKRIAWRHPAFNYRFDAIVYAVCASLGFAALENIGYVFMMGGISTAIVRAITAIPGHAVFGVFMGYYLGEAKVCEADGNLNGLKRNMKRSLVIPVLIHGIYDFCASSDSLLALLLFVVFIIYIDVRAFKRVKRASEFDMPV